MRNLKVSISAVLYDQHGNLLRKYRPKPAHSFLSQFIELLYILISQVPTDVTDTSGSENSIGLSTSNIRLSALASDTAWGLLIGSGTDPVTIDDYVLQTPITVDLTVGNVIFALSYPTSSSRRLSISRTFTNDSASPMAIEEVALYNVTAPAFTHCMDRTLYSVSIPALSSLTLTYRIDVSV